MTRCEHRARFGEAMGRILEFEDQEALERAMHVFWEKGYQNTSLKDLLGAMNILNGSFYNTFGNKKNVYLKALQMYELDFNTKIQKLFAPDKPFAKKIRIFFDYVINRQLDKTFPKGCFVVNSIESSAVSEPDIRKFLTVFFTNFEAYISKELGKAVANGELSADIDPEHTAAAINAYTQGLMKLSILTFSPTEFHAHTEYLLKRLGL